MIFFFFSSRRRHTRYWRDWSSDVCSSDLGYPNRKIAVLEGAIEQLERDLVEAQGRTGGDTLLWRAEIQAQLLLARQNLALAENVERARIVEGAVARKATAQSRRNRIVVGAVLGLLAGLAAAFARESVSALRE